MKVGFIGLGNVGGKLAGSLLRNGYDLYVLDLDEGLATSLIEDGAHWCDTPKKLTHEVDVVITCLPNPAASAAVVEGEDGILSGISQGKIWLEMSTTEKEDVKRLAELLFEKGAFAMDCPVSGGCHRAATGNISIFAGGERNTFDKVLPLLTAMGRRILHTGPLGSACVLKVVTNYLCSVHLAALGEAFCVAKLAGMDMNTTYEAIRISSGNSFVHETESQVILNGSYNINFTMDLVLKDMGLFNTMAQHYDAPLEIAPLALDIFKDGEQRYGARAWSSQIVKRMEDQCNVAFRGTGFSEEIFDDEAEEPGYEVKAS